MCKLKTIRLLSGRKYGVSDNDKVLRYKNNASRCMVVDGGISHVEKQGENKNDGRRLYACVLPFEVLLIFE